MRRCAAFIAALLVTAGCATRPAVIATQPLWPFEQLEIRTSIGRVFGYVSRPQLPAKHLIVVINQSPCPQEFANVGPELLGTSGIVWQEFKDDSLFFQFERPGRSSELTRSPCEKSTGDRSADHRRALIDAVEAIRELSQLDNVPTTHIGVGEHALLAVELALGDARASAVVLIAVAAEQIYVASDLTRELAKTPALKILVVRTTRDVASSSHAEQIQSSLVARLATSTLLVNSSSPEVAPGMESDCLEQVAQALGAFVRAREIVPESRHVSCYAHEPPPPPAAAIERIEKH